MKRVVINAVTAFLLMLVQSNVDSAFGIQAMAQFGIIAAVLTGMTSMPMVSSAISMLIFALLCDVFTSGPIGLAAFVFMLVFGIGRAIVARFKSERVIAVMIFCATMTILFEFLLAIVYCAYYREFVFLSIFVSQFWNDVLLTALLTPAVMTINHALESIFVRRKKASLS